MEILTSKKLVAAGVASALLVALGAWPIGAARTRSDSTNAGCEGPSRNPTDLGMAKNEACVPETESSAVDIGDRSKARKAAHDPDSDAALVESLDEFIRTAPSLRDGAARLERFLEEPGNEELVARLVRLVASRDLLQGSTRQAVVLAIVALPEPRFSVSKTALWKVLGNQEHDDATASAALVHDAAVSGGGPSLEHSLSRIGDAELRDTELVRTVESLALDESATAEVRKAALDALARARTTPGDATSTEIQRFLSELLNRRLDGDLEVAAVRALASQRGELAAETLAALLADDTRLPATRRFAASGLNHQPGGPTVARELIDAHRTDSDPEVRNAALLSLGAYAAVASDALEELLRAIRSDADVDARRYAALALAAVVDPRVESALAAAAAADPSILVREVAAVALRAQQARARS